MNVPSLAESPAEPHDAVLTIVRVDPKKRPLVFDGGTFKGDQMPTATEWAKEKGLALATNAGRFRNSDAVAYLKGNGTLLKAMKHKGDDSFFLFDPVDPKQPAARILDARCDDVDAEIPRYRTVVQSRTSLGCRPLPPGWGHALRRRGVALAAVDARGRVLFIYTRSPYTELKLSEALSALPLEIGAAINLDDGLGSALALHAGKTFMDLGIEGLRPMELGFSEIPWVIGVKALKK